MREEITVLNYEESDDGGAIVHLSLSLSAKNALIEEGFIAVLTRSIEKETLDFHRKECHGQQRNQP